MVPSHSSFAQRIIPAYAGSTAARRCSPRPVRGSSPHTRGARGGPPQRRGPVEDHPRIRGEHVAAVGGILPVVGIIPAYAGSTVPYDEGGGAIGGSSPHTRGAHLTTCVTILHSPALDSLVRVQWCISTRPPPRTYPPNFLAARYLLALLQPF